MDVLFPQQRTVVVFNTLTTEPLAQRVTRVMVSTPFPCVAFLPYRDKLVRYAIRATKYHNHRRAAKLLGNTIAPLFAEELGEQQMFGAFQHATVVPIPLYPKRERTRGFNQTTRIAQALCTNSQDHTLRVDTSLLIRIKDTHSQTQQYSRADRIKNMQGAFQVPDSAQVYGKDIVLLDDVVTTGATFGAARSALKQAGARHVLCIAVAH